VDTDHVLGVSPTGLALGRSETPDDRPATGGREHTTPPWITFAGMDDLEDADVARHEFVRLAGIPDART